MMLELLHLMAPIVVWEALRYIKRQWKLAEERAEGLRWECPDCKTVFASSDKALVTRWVVDHDMSMHNKDEGDEDEKG
jgi:hypothetical protein